MATPHVLVIPYPAQGHVIPAVELARCLIKNGVKVTFVNTEAIQTVVKSNLVEKDGYEDLMDMVSIPDGLEPWEDRNDQSKLYKSIIQSMPRKLEELVEKINTDETNQVTCIIPDLSLGCAIRVAKKMGIRTAAFWPAAATTLATMMSSQKLIHEGTINKNGVPLNDDTIQLSETIPIKPAHLPWMCTGDVATLELCFQYATGVAEGASLTEKLICNSSIELEPATFNEFPQLLPIGPLLASNRLANQTGHFWKEDATCLNWLDQQPPRSVIYVAFGSITIFSETQIEELALGLEICNRPFLWVVRTGMTKESTTGTFPDGYLKRVESFRKIVSWAPQQKVLAHPSVVCFVSHCGWNSTFEGVVNGLPFLCWPYFTDQILNANYICEIWKTGLGLRKDEQGVISRGEIKSKVEQLLSDKEFKGKALQLKEKVRSSVVPGGRSHQNFRDVIEWIHEKDTDANGQQ